LGDNVALGNGYNYFRKTSLNNWEYNFPLH
jgi:hypothetical protein